MASIGPKYTKSAVDVISPMLTINQQLQSRNDTSWNRLMTGTKGLSEGIGNALMVKKRSDVIKYNGDEYIAQLEAEKRELLEEKQRIKNEMNHIESVPDEIDASDVHAKGLPSVRDMEGYVPSEPAHEYNPMATNYPFYNTLEGRRPDDDVVMAKYKMRGF